MIVLAIVFAAGVTFGCIVSVLALRWPTAVGAPALDQGRVRAEVRRSARLRHLLRSPLSASSEASALLALALTAMVAAAAAVGILLAMVRAHWGLEWVDGPAARFAAREATSLSTTVLRDVSLLGGTAGLVVLLVVVGISEYRRRPNRAIAPFLVLCVLGQFAVANLVKISVDRARPAVDRLTGFSGSSFPSGHAVASASAFAAFALLMGRGRSRAARAGLSGAAAGIAATVAASRVFLGVHWCTDVLAGLCLGWGWFALCSLAFGGRLLRFAAPVASAEAAASGPAPV